MKKGKKHTGAYHPMNILHIVLDLVDIPSCCNLYQKHFMGKLVVPVFCMRKKLTYIIISLHPVKVSYTDSNKRE